MNIQIWDLLTVETKMLAFMWRVSTGEIQKRRVMYTGHTRRFSERWALTVGSWGRVRSIEEIKTLLGDGTERRVIRDYAKGMHLKTASKSLRRTHAELAVLLWCDRHGTTAKESCEKYGVLPVERTLLCSYLQTMMDHDRIGIRDVLGWSSGHLESEWKRHGFSLEPPILRSSWFELHSADERENYVEYRHRKVQRELALRERILNRPDVSSSSA